jgi:hypothetical protein
MARSLTVSHTETPGTSRLFNGFLLLALAWLMAGMLVAGLNVGDADAAETMPVLDQK